MITQAASGYSGIGGDSPSTAQPSQTKHAVGKYSTVYCYSKNSMVNFPGGSVDKNLCSSAGDTKLDP